ncbi:MAG: translation elongation factor 4 [Planctomycetota bacterium]|nr:translation elongation factor 4 [Planctomycetota bacterium]
MKARIRNFCIVAHIDHGKSTLADRLLLRTGTISEREFRNQVLDDMDLERERGITIKASAVTMRYARSDGEYTLNLIDTPGHVDFSYEVSRALAACEGALLVVDASQGVEAQTVANAIKAIEAGLDIIPVINKIDLPSARIDIALQEMEQVLGLRPEESLRVSAKEGIGIDPLLEAVISRIRPPAGDENAPLRALIFDSKYDDYKGVIAYIRVVDGAIRRGDRIRMHHSGKTYEVIEVGRFQPAPVQREELVTGEVGYVAAAIKDVREVKIGDTIVSERADPRTTVPLPGYKEAKPMVFCGLYPANNVEFEPLKRALEKLYLNDSSFTFQPENSQALGFGFRCGFLGMLHMDIIRERLEREFDLELIQTAPTVTYQVLMTDGSVMEAHSAGEIPDASRAREIREPIVRLQLIVPAESIGAVIKLCEDRRGRFISQEWLGRNRVMLCYSVPLAEMVFDFFDRLKSLTRGHGTMDYTLEGFQTEDLVKVDILVAGQIADALSFVCHRSEAEKRGRKILLKLRKQIPRHLFQIALQAAIGGKIIARENISPLAKNVLSKCYGGDITRKRKLLEKQKEGKKRMKSIGQVEVPQEAFLAVLQTGEED